MKEGIEEGMGMGAGRFGVGQLETGEVELQAGMGMEMGWRFPQRARGLRIPRSTPPRQIS